MTARQLSIDDLAEGERLRDEAFTGLDEADRGDWEKRVIMRAIRETARSLDKFSANDVRSLLPEVNTNRIGRCFAQAAKDGLIEWAGMERSNDPKTHGHRINVWTGCFAPDPDPQYVSQEWIDHLSRTTAREDPDLVLPWLEDEETPMT